MEKKIVLLLFGLLILHVLLFATLRPNRPKKNETQLTTSSENKDKKYFKPTNTPDRVSLKTAEYSTRDEDKMLPPRVKDKTDMNFIGRDHNTVNTTLNNKKVKEDHIGTQFQSRNANDSSDESDKITSMANMNGTNSIVKTVPEKLENAKNMTSSMDAISRRFKTQTNSTDRSIMNTTEENKSVSINPLSRREKIQPNSTEVTVKSKTNTTKDKRLEAAVMSGASHPNSTDTMKNVTKDEIVEMTGAVTPDGTNPSTMSTLSKQTRLNQTITKTLKNTMRMERLVKGHTKESNSADLNFLNLDLDEYNDGGQLVGDNRDGDSGDIDMGQLLDDYGRGFRNETVTNEGDRLIE